MKEILEHVGARTIRVGIDLKWSAWSRDREHWKVFAPTTLRLLDTMEPGHTLEIITAPRKEVRFGWVTVTCHEDEDGPRYHIWGTLWEELDDDRRRSVEIRGEAGSIDGLLEAVDEAENNLLQPNPEAGT